MSEAGVQNGAILLLALGEDEASEVMKYLGPRDVQRLGVAMSKMKSVDNDELLQVLEQFKTQVETTTSLGVDSEAYIRSVLTRALGDERAGSLLTQIMGERNISGIESLRWMDAQSVAELIKNEHPQIIATILVHLERFHACEIIEHFTERLRNDVVLRIATLDGVQPSALRELDDVLTKLLSGGANMKQQMGGVRTAAEILNFLSGESETSVMENLKAYDPSMAQAIMEQRFVFENILDIDDRGIQMILKEVQGEALIVALKGSSQEMRDKIFKNMSQRAAEMLKDDLESKGPVRLSEVEAQQKEILVIVRRLADEGQIVLGTSGDDAYV